MYIIEEKTKEKHPNHLAFKNLHIALCPIVSQFGPRTFKRQLFFEDKSLSCQIWKTSLSGCNM